MNGLEISERYFWDHGYPLIEQKFGLYKERIASGLIGEGSECFGFDDEISRDHDWGPRFCLWLTKQDYQEISLRLKKELASLPAEYEGIEPGETTEWGKNRAGVFEIGEFYKRFIGFDHIPTELKDWRLLNEIQLAACTNGKVFTDPLGEFTRFRLALKNFYPEDIRLKKIASRCMTLAQLGQYNFLRCVKRKEMVAASYVEAQFCAHIISLVFLLNREYPPFYKWMHRALGRLPILGEVIHPLLSEIVSVISFDKKARLIKQVCLNVIDELRVQGLSDSSSPFFLDHAPVIQSKIQNEALRNVDLRFE